MRTLLAVVSFASFSSFAQGMVQSDFSVPSLDGKTRITGEIDLPDTAASCPKCTYPAVVMIPGTGLFDRDVLFGATGTDRDLVFRDLAVALAAAGMASVRYDYRGVSCSPRTMPPCPSCTTAQRNELYINSCINNDVRSSVTMQNIDDDIAVVYQYAATQPKIDASRIAVFAHSEGTLHAARLVASGTISPSGLLLMGMVAESPMGVIHWQEVERAMRIFAWDADHDGVLTNDEIRAGFAKDSYFSSLGYTVDNLLAPTGSWTESSLRSYLEAAYQASKTAALSHADTDPMVVPIPGQPTLQVVDASYGWWKAWFTDDTPDVELLSSYGGPIIAHNGDNDSQTPGVREFGILENASRDFVTPPQPKLHPGLGHGLSPDSPIMGPIAPYVRDMIVQDLQSLTTPPPLGAALPPAGAMPMALRSLMHGLPGF